jgi:hypothetical protein
VAAVAASRLDYLELPDALAGDVELMADRLSALLATPG